MPDPVFLRALQRRMLGRLMAAVSGTPSEVGLEFVSSDARRGPAMRLQVYEEMYYLRLREALAAYYPCTAGALGERFDDVARAYLSCHPSRHPSLRELGDRLPAFLRDTSPAAVGRPWLWELAALERARLDVFDALDQPLLSRAGLAALPPAGFAALSVELATAQRRLTCAWDVTRLFAAATDAVSGRFQVLVGRRGAHVYHRRLDALEADLLSRLSIAAPFGQVCEWIAEQVGEERAAEVGCALLARWGDDELLVAPGQQA
jgi:hypothetical protein